MTPTRREGSARTRGGIDWDLIRSRVEEAGRALASGGVTHADHRAILDARARALARPLDTAAADVLDAVAFELGGERYAIESRYVVEVFRLRRLSPLPGAEPPVYGIAPWRGQLITILDVRSLLGLPVTSLTDLHHVAVIDDGLTVFGMLAGTMGGVVSIPTRDIGPLPPGAAAPSRHLVGTTTDALLLIDPVTLFTAGAEQ